MNSFIVKAGDTVKKGQLIGFSGDRKKTQPNLHFEIRKDGIAKNQKRNKQYENKIYNSMFDFINVCNSGTNDTAG